MHSADMHNRLEACTKTETGIRCQKPLSVKIEHIKLISDCHRNTPLQSDIIKAA